MKWGESVRGRMGGGSGSKKPWISDKKAAHSSFEMDHVDAILADAIGSSSPTAAAAGLPKKTKNIRKLPAIATATTTTTTGTATTTSPTSATTSSRSMRANSSYEEDEPGRLSKSSSPTSISRKGALLKSSPNRSTPVKHTDWDPTESTTTSTSNTDHSTNNNNMNDDTITSYNDNDGGRITEYKSPPHHQKLEREQNWNSPSSYVTANEVATTPTSPPPTTTTSLINRSNPIPTTTINSRPDRSDDVMLQLPQSSPVLEVIKRLEEPIPTSISKSRSYDIPVLDVPVKEKAIDYETGKLLNSHIKNESYSEELAYMVQEGMVMKKVETVEMTEQQIFRKQLAYAAAAVAQRRIAEEMARRAAAQALELAIEQAAKEEEMALQAKIRIEQELQQQKELAEMELQNELRQRVLDAKAKAAAQDEQDRMNKAQEEAAASVVAATSAAFDADQLARIQAEALEQEEMIRIQNEEAEEDELLRQQEEAEEMEIQNALRQRLDDAKRFAQQQQEDDEQNSQQYNKALSPTSVSVTTTTTTNASTSDVLIEEDDIQKELRQRIEDAKTKAKESALQQIQQQELQQKQQQEQRGDDAETKAKTIEVNSNESFVGSNTNSTSKRLTSFNQNHATIAEHNEDDEEEEIAEDAEVDADNIILVRNDVKSVEIKMNGQKEVMESKIDEKKLSDDDNIVVQPKSVVTSQKDSAETVTAQRRKPEPIITTMSKNTELHPVTSKSKSTINNEFVEEELHVEDNEPFQQQLQMHQRQLSSTSSSSTIHKPPVAVMVANHTYDQRNNIPDDVSNFSNDDSSLLQQNHPQQHSNQMFQKSSNQSTASSNTSLTNNFNNGSNSTSPRRSISDIIRHDLWNKNEVIVEQALQQLVEKAALHNSYRNAIARAGGILAIIRAMEQHTNHVGIQISGCVALEKLAIDTENELAIGEVGGIEAILSAMMSHYTNGKVHEAAWSALWNCTCGNACDTLTIDTTPGGMTAIISCMKQHVDNVTVQISACNTIMNLCYDNNERIQLLVEADGFGAIVQAIQTHYSNTTVRNEMSYILCTLLEKNVKQHYVSQQQQDNNEENINTDNHNSNNNNDNGDEEEIEEEVVEEEEYEEEVYEEEVL